MSKQDGVFVRLKLIDATGPLNMGGVEFDEQGISEPVIPRVARRLIGIFPLTLDETSLPEGIADLDGAVVAAIAYDTDKVSREHNARLEEQREREAQQAREAEASAKKAREATDTDKSEGQAGGEDLGPSGVFEHVEGAVYSDEQLGIIADREGINGLRKIAEALGVKGRSIRELIENILKAQEAKE